MKIGGYEYCKKCHKQTKHLTSLDPNDPLRCTVCGNVYQPPVIIRIRKRT